MPVLNTKEQVAAAELAAQSPIADLVAATTQLTNFTIPPEDLPGAANVTARLNSIDALAQPLDSDVNTLSVLLHTLVLKLSALLPSTPSEPLDHLSLTIDHSSVIETGAAPVVTPHAWEDSAGMMPYTGALVYSYSSSVPSVASIDAMTGVVTLQAPGATTLSASASGITATVILTVTAAAQSYATPLFRDDMGYVNRSALLNNVQTSGGGTGPSTAAWATIESNDTCLVVVDTTPEGKYNGYNTIRYDFLPTSQRDNGGRVEFNYPSGTHKVWARFATKFQPGFTTAGIMASDNAQAYKLFLSGNNQNGFSGSDRLEITNITNYDNYGGAASSTGGTSGGPTAFQGGVELGNITNEWSDDNWYEYIVLKTVTADQLTRTTTWWKCVKDTAPALLSTFSATLNNGGQIPPVDGFVLGANFNQARTSTVTMFRGPTSSYDASIYHNPYGVPFPDIATVASTLGSDTSVAAPIVAPPAPGVPIPGNSTSASTNRLTFPLTIASSGGLPFGLAVRWSSNGGTTWTDGSSIALSRTVVLEGTVNVDVTGLPTAAQLYTVQFATLNPGGQSAWSSSVTGTTASSDTLPVTNGLALWLDASSGLSTEVDGATVHTWMDQSPTGVVYTAPSGAEPIVAGNYQNGLSVLKLSTGKYLVADAVRAAALGTANWTSFAIFATPNSTETRITVFDNANSDQSDGYQWYESQRVNSDGPRILVANNGFGTSLVRSSSLNIGIGAAPSPDNSNEFVTIDLTSAVIDGGGMPTPNTTSPTAIGTQGSAPGTNTGEAWVAEIVQFNRGLSWAEIGSMVSYLKFKWGIA